MICDCCRRDVDYVRGSFWLGDARICRECFAQWYNPDDDHVDASDTASIANYVRLRHGLPPIAAALTIMALALTTTAYASRHCLDQTEAARTWPTRSLMKDGDGCWTYDRRPSRGEVRIATPEAIVPVVASVVRPPKLMERWPETNQNLIQLELREFDPQPTPESKSSVNVRQVALFVSLVLAVVSVIEVVTGRQGTRVGSAAGRSAEARTHWASRS
jgi:hypothetical protein